MTLDVAIHQPISRTVDSKTPDYDAAIIGAGPYGLSAAAYLKRLGLSVCLFGEPMDFWAHQMPAGMLLRSPRAASSIADPRSVLTLEAYEASAGLKAESRVPLGTFVNYGRWFHDEIRAGSDVTHVRTVVRENSTFRLTLQNKMSVTSRRVIVAAGIRRFARVPKVFAGLPPSRVSHCYDGVDVSDFKDARVAVIGAGQSALESAALLHEARAEVEVVARIARLRWIGRYPRLHRLGPVSRILYSPYDVGPAGISRLVSWPKLVSEIPMPLRDAIRTRAVRSAGSPWLAPRLKNVTISTGCSIRSARLLGDELELNLSDGSKKRVDRVLLGTGYQVDVSRYDFLSPALLSNVRRLDGYPVLANGLCSSVPGLHFVGAPAAKSFGPLLYFVAGTEFASRQLASHMTLNRVPVA